MTVLRTLRSSWIIAVAALAAVTLPAQIQPGWAVVGSFRAPPSFNTPGVGGLWAVHPMTPGTATPITGLPGWITGCQWPTAQYAGIDFVLRLPDGRLVTNGWPWPLPATPVTMQIGILTLSGTAVTSVQTYPCGTLTGASNLGIPQAALLPNGRVLLATDRIGQPGDSLYGATLAILDPSLPPGPTNPAPVPLSGWTPLATQSMNALCVDPTGSTAWFGTTDFVNGWPSYVYRVTLGPIPTAPVMIAALPAVLVRNMAFEPATGSVIVGGYGPGGNLIRCNGTTGTLTPVAFPAAVNALVVEPSTGAIIVATSSPGPETVWRLAPGAATPILLSSGPPPGANCTGSPGWAALGAIDVAPTHQFLGPGVAGTTSSYDWNLSPTPNGLPYTGNPSFTLTLQSATGAVGGWLGISSAPSTPPLLVGAGIPIYVDPASLIVVLDLAATTTITFGPVVVPPGFAGVSIFFQSLHFDGAASSGLAVTIL